MSNSVRDKIVALIGAGVSSTIAAEAAGVTPSYVSQLLTLPDVLAEVAQLRSGKLEAALESDTTLEAAELAALKKTKQLIPFIRSAAEGAKVFTALNAARRKAMDDRSDQQFADQVTIVLPKAAKIMITMNSDNQIVEVDGRSMAPLPSKALPAMLSRLETKQVVISPPQHITDIKEKAARMDVQRAHQILQDIETVIDGVRVVI